MALHTSCSTSIAGRVALAVIGLALFAVASCLAPAPALAQALPGPELIMFEEASCPWCRLWDREVGQAYPRSEEGRRAPLRRIQISEARRSGLALKSPVTVTPTFVLMDRGAEVGRIIGYPGADFFWGMLGELIARLPKAPAPSGLRDASFVEPRAPERDAASPMPVRFAAGRERGEFSPRGVVRHER